MRSILDLIQAPGNRLVLAAGLLLAATGSAPGQTRVLPLGDSITQGGQGYVSYRYELWFDLQNDGYDVDLVGQRDFTNDEPPDSTWYPDYFTTFDRDHEGYWGWRTDEIATILPGAATAAQPDVVLMHLGTNDVGQLGAAGVVNADTNLRTLVGQLRAVNPDVTILLARVIPIGPGTSYFANADQVDSLNAAVDTIAADSTTAQSPVLVVDQNIGFDLGTMMRSDGLHPNLLGEAFMADRWRTMLATILPPSNPRPSVFLTSPADGAELTEGDLTSITADATDPNGFVVEVRFFSGGTLLGSDASAPYSFDWTAVPVGVHVLTAEAEDDEGATSASDPVTVTVLPPGGVAVTIANPSFETPALADGSLAAGPGVLGDWTFSGTTNTFVGIFNPPEGSYPGAGGNGTPSGADGANVAYLFNDGGPAEAVSAEQTLTELLAPGTEYTLRVAIGRFRPEQPYSYSEYGGYVIELRAGANILASDTGSVNPPVGEFRDALLVLEPDAFHPVLLGEPLTVRLGIASTEEDRSTHFDDVRLSRRDLSASAASSSPSALELIVAPNPFRVVTNVHYSLASPATVSIDVYDVAGRRVQELVRPRLHPSGVARVRFDPPSTGVYFVRIHLDGREAVTKRVVKVR